MARSTESLRSSSMGQSSFSAGTLGFRVPSLPAICRQVLPGGPPRGACRSEMLLDRLLDEGVQHIVGVAVDRPVAHPFELVVGRVAGNLGELLVVLWRSLDVLCKRHDMHGYMAARESLG